MNEIRPECKKGVLLISTSKLARLKGSSKMRLGGSDSNESFSQNKGQHLYWERGRLARRARGARAEAWQTVQNRQD